MRTYDPKIARTIGAALHGKSEQVFECIAEASLTQQEAKAWLEHVVTEELKRIQTRRLVEQDSPETGAFEDNRLLDELTAHCYRLLFEKGQSADFAPVTDRKIAEHGYPAATIKHGQYLLDILRQDFRSESRHARIRSLYSEILGHSEMGSLRYLELRRLMMKCKAIAYAASQPLDKLALDRSIQAAEAEISRHFQCQDRQVTLHPIANGPADHA